MFGDFLEMRANGVEADTIVDGDGGDEDVEPWDGESSATEPLGEGDGAVPIVLAAWAVRDDRKAFPKVGALLQSGTAEDHWAS